MEYNKPGSGSQKRIYRELRGIQREQREKNSSLEEQLVLLNSKLDNLSEMLVSTQKILLDSICNKCDDSIVIQSDNHKELMEKVKIVEDVIKKYSCDHSEHLDTNYNQLQDLMKIIIANELLKPLNLELESRI